MSVRSQYEQDRQATANIGGGLCYFSAHNQGSIYSLPPNVIGYYSWTGPAFLESRLRSWGIPWFDRITRVDILSDRCVDASSLEELLELPNLEQVTVYDATVSRSLYHAAADASENSVAIEFINH